MVVLGSACSHVAALLYQIEKFIHARETSEKKSLSIEVNKEVSRNSLNSTDKLMNFSKVKKGDLSLVPLLTFSYVKSFLTNSPMAGEIPLTNEELKDLYTINPEAVFFTATDKTYFLTENERKYTQTATASITELELPEPLISQFDPTGVQIFDKNSKTCCNKKYELYQKTCSIDSYNNFLTSKCYHVFHTDTEKISSPSLLATIRQYSDTKSNKYNRYGIDNKLGARKYFAETQNAHHENMIVNETGFKVYAEYPCIGASLDGTATCLCHEIRRLEIMFPYSYQKDLFNWDNDRTLPVDRSNSIKKNNLYHYHMQLQMPVYN